MIGNEFRFQLHIQDLIHEMTKDSENHSGSFQITSFRSLFRPFPVNQPRRLRDPRFLHPKRVLIFLTIKCTSRAIIMFSRGWSLKIVETGAEAGGRQWRRGDLRHRTGIDSFSKQDGQKSYSYLISHRKVVIYYFFLLQFSYFLSLPSLAYIASKRHL